MVTVVALTGFDLAFTDRPTQKAYLSMNKLNKTQD